MATRAVELGPCVDSITQQLGCVVVMSYVDRGDCFDASCVILAEENGVGDGSVDVSPEEDVDFPVVCGMAERKDVDVSDKEVVSVNVEVDSLEMENVLAENVNVEVDAPVENGMGMKVENVDASVKEVDNMNAEVDFQVVNGTIEVKDVDASVKEVVSVNLDVDSLETENLLLSINEVENVNVVLVEGDYPAVNGILTGVDAGSTKDSDGLQVVELCAHAVEQHEPTELRAKCEIQPVELCDGILNMVVVPELEMVGEKETDFKGVANAEKELGVESGADPIDTSEYVGSTTENESCKGVDEAHELFLSTTGNVSAKDIVEAQNVATAPTSNVTVTYKEVTSCLSSNEEDASYITWGISNIMFGTLNVEEMGDQQNGPIGSKGQNLILEDNETNDAIEIESSCSFNAGVVGEDQKVEAKPFNYLVKFPRADDESLKKQINLRKVLVDKYTKLRDDIQVQIHETRKANNLNNGINYEYAKKELSASRNLVKLKRKEIDSLQCVINKVKNAASIQDLDRQISDMEFTIQHESISLKEEKQIIKNIKQSKQRREELRSHMNNEEGIKESLEQRGTLDERMKVLRKELDALTGNITKAGAAVREAVMKYDEENEKVKELQARSRAANDSRQESYLQMQSLRKDLYDKNKHFYMYKGYRTAATEHAHNRETEALHVTCQTQVENFMELWNTNAEFRREYATRNMKSTLRRFGTLDGRSLGPDEKHPILPDKQVEKATTTYTKVDCVLESPILEVKKENMSSADKSKLKIPQAKSQLEKLMAAAEPILAGVSGRDILEVVGEEPVKSKEEIELAKKAEEMRRKEAEDKLKEQRRLEELAKADEARERKKRQEEKEKRRAQVRAQKEAEQKDKERQKRLRRKEKKEALLKGSINSTDDSDVRNFESAVETSKEMEAKEMEVKKVSTAKNLKMSPVVTKQVKQRYVPPPPCIRNKRSWKHNPWVIKCICAIVMILVAYIGVTWFRSEKPLL